MEAFKINNTEIGTYLAKLIEKNFSTRRDFCREYIRIDKGLPKDQPKIEEEELINMSNRLSQIIKGKKGVQLTDLPIFCQILSVSCEEILSAGKNFSSVKDNRPTNYSIAHSSDRTEWENYINSKDKLIRHYDEYGKSVIDHALECQNCDFLFYLMEKGYIQIVNPDPTKREFDFGAEAEIPKSKSEIPIDTPADRQKDALFDRIYGDKYITFRNRLIGLAVNNNRIDMLEKLLAREIPAFYQDTPGCPSSDSRYRNNEMLDTLASTQNHDILSYFSSEFEISRRCTGIKNMNGYSSCEWDSMRSCIYPFLGELLNRMICRKHEYADEMLRSAKEHNRRIAERTREFFSNRIKASAEKCTKEFQERQTLPGFTGTDEMLHNAIINYVRTYTNVFWDENVDLFFFQNYFNSQETVISNIIHVTVSSENADTQKLITELNNYYDEIKTISTHPETLM